MISGANALESQNRKPDPGFGLSRYVVTAHQVLIKFLSDEGEFMSEHNNGKIGSIGWADLTVENASQLKDFYHEVVGWGTADVDMGGYSDFCMNELPTNNSVAGICHARGLNAEVPPVWLIYITVADLDASMAKCRALGGEVIAGPRRMGRQGRYCVVRDPAGAVAALFEHAA
jgi:predicted enzyme related to lactoylglutathione lyase